MNYLKHYIKLIRKRKLELITVGERHHIFPQSIFGKNNSIVKLSVREHFIAHKLIYKICQKRYGDDHNKTIRMLFALRHMMKDIRNNEKRKETSLIVSSKMMEEIRKIHPTVLPEVRQKISKSKNGIKLPMLNGDKNPSKRNAVREKISASKTGVSREDLKGKAYFGASIERITEGIEKMRQKKIGVKIENYPKKRKSRQYSAETAKAISDSRLKTKEKFVNMTDAEFETWIAKQNLYRKDGRLNPNITRVLVWRNIPKEKYYETEKR